ncbi:MAG: M16 family metallopeptidase [Vulcanimicrobiaceae bacterium]
MYRTTTLPNGLRVISERMPHVRSATLGIWADVGSAAERAEQRGVSHLVEHMLFKGTTGRSAREIAETIDRVGGSLNAFTDKESTCYYAKVIDHHVPLALDVLADMFLDSTIEPAELAKEQKVVLDEIRMYEDAPDDSIHDLFVRTMWSGSHLGEPTIGFAHTVSSLQSDDLRRHLSEHYAPNAVMIAVAGNVEHEALVAEVERAFAAFGGSCVAPEAQAPRATPATKIVRKETEQVYIVLGCEGLSARDERRYVLAVLDAILGGGMSSRLFQQVREKRGLAYSVFSFHHAYRAAGLFGVSAGTAPESVAECIDVITDELATIAAQGPSEAELLLAREHLKGSLTLSLESTSSRMMRLGRSEFTLGRHPSIEEIEAEIDAVARDDVHALAAALLKPERLGLCVLGPVEHAEIRWRPDAAVA